MEFYQIDAMKVDISGYSVSNHKKYSNIVSIKAPQH